MIVAIANGGLLPAALLHERLGLEANVLRINWRAPDNTPRGPAPRLLRGPNFDFAGKRLILADDRIKSGSTIAFAKKSSPPPPSSAPSPSTAPPIMRSTTKTASVCRGGLAAV
jgi:hypothetical protein